MMMKAICAYYIDRWFENSYETDQIPDDGIAFEHWCADKLSKIGWETTVSKASGDQGMDVMATDGETTICIQCKRYARPVGNKAVQEAFAAKQHVDADAACVIATGGFTNSAKELASSTKVVLLDAELIESFSDYF